MSIQYRQLKKDEYLDSNGMKTIAELIYETDPYIYPAMFSSLECAVAIIPEMIRLGDSMFKRENIFVAEENGCICGIVLWVKGKLDWNAAIYERCAGLKGLTVSQYLSEVTERYLSTYALTPDDTTSIINVCVRRMHQGRGIGTKMLESFIRQANRPLELFVLKENELAVSVYKKLGFTISEQIQGFSIEQRDLPCYRMIYTYR